MSYNLLRRMARSMARTSDRLLLALASSLALYRYCNLMRPFSSKAFSPNNLLTYVRTRLGLLIAFWIQYLLRMGFHPLIINYTTYLNICQGGD